MDVTPIQIDARSTTELVNILLTANEADTDDGDSPYWIAMRVLHRRGTSEVLEVARSLCESVCPHEQQTGCDILSQLGGSESPFAAVSFPLVLSVLRETEDLDTLASALCALGWLADLRAVPYVLPHVDHPDSDIRFHVTSTLTALDGDERSIDGLIRLSADSCATVRDWATFGLGSQIEQDSPAIRQALVARLDDPDDIVRGEALVGLAKRQDERVVEPLGRAIESGTYKKSVNDYAGEALDALDLQKYPHLQKWKSNA